MKAKLTKKVLVGSACVLAFFLLVFHVAVSLWIGSGVRDATAIALQQYEGDRVDALIQYVEAPTHTLRERNHAVWALGQLGDSRALPTVQRYYTGEPCDHSSEVCQRELGKAKELLEGGLNITAFVWR